MRFKAGFVLGCAAGAWAASKASQIKRGDARGDWPGLAPARPSRPSKNAQKVTTITSIARERIADLVEGQLKTIAREHMADVLSPKRQSPST